MNPSCPYDFPHVYRLSVGATIVRYRAACNCGWVFTTEGPADDSPGVRATAQAEALQHYMPSLTPAQLRQARRLFPAARSKRQVNNIIDLLCGFGVFPSEARSWSTFLPRVQSLGASIEAIDTPIGRSYQLKGVQE